MPRMNGSEPKIEIFKPFGEAFELTKKILFQPFDLKKWFVIGFAAWLANLGVGGGGFNYQDNRREGVQKLNEAISQIPHPILVTGVCVLIAFVLVLIVLFAWLRARGRFLFIDCIVKNRGAIAEPWRDLVHRRDSLYRHRDFAAGLCLASFVFAVVSAAIRPGLRCVGDLRATGILFNLVIGTALAATAAAFVAGRVKRIGELRS